jgi:hypothetical protein
MLRYVGVMVARHQVPKEYSPEQLRLLAAQFRRWAEEFDGAAEKVDKLNEKSLYVFNASSLEKGIAGLTAYMGELARSVSAVLVGKPLRTDSRKTRQKKYQLAIAEMSEKYK